ncbi:MAG: TraB/GumN family protein [Lentisphaerae bacterium]|nr:TraB/GumN family protein [Lentisphaerota bacterium]
MKTIRDIRLLLAGLLLAWAAGQAPAQTNASTDARHMLWVVSGASNTVYLEGSIHLLKPEHYPLPEPMEQAYRDSQTLVTEVDLAAMRTPDVQLSLLARGRLPDGQTLRDVLSPDLYADASRRLGIMTLTIDAFQTFKPWLLAMTMTMINMQTLGYSSEHGVDAYFDARARQDGKPVLALETVDAQLGLFDSLSGADADALLRYTLLELDTMDADLGRMVEAWSRGDCSVLRAILLEGFESFPHLENKLLTNRNHAWVSVIEPFLHDDQNYLVVVGAGHLLGPQSVVALLQARGYRVEQR